MISLRVGQPVRAMVSSSSSFSVSRTFLTPSSPLAARPNTTGLPICKMRIEKVAETHQIQVINEKFQAEKMNLSWLRSKISANAKPSGADNEEDVPLQLLHPEPRP